MELLLVAVGYAAAPVIANTVLADVPSIGVIAVSVAVVAALYLPWTVAGYSGGDVSMDVLAAVVVLGLVCTALAFVLFFRLIALAGPVRATVITFINPGRGDRPRAPRPGRAAHLGHGPRVPARAAGCLLGDPHPCAGRRVIVGANA